MEGYLAELLAVNHTQALLFFHKELIDICDPRVDKVELLYNASVLAHFSQTSTYASCEYPAPRNLSDVFDEYLETFLEDSVLLADEEMLETAGSHCLLFTGFFRDQTKTRHNIRWFSKLGAAYFVRAANMQRSEGKARLLLHISQRFDFWRDNQTLLSRSLRDRPYLIPKPTST